jgi:outer membrane biogenesis lipoprotein LolB
MSLRRAALMSATLFLAACSHTAPTNTGVPNQQGQAQGSLTSRLRAASNGHQPLGRQSGFTQAQSAPAPASTGRTDPPALPGGQAEDASPE